MNQVLSGCAVHAAIQQEKASKPPVDDHHAHCCEACGHIWWHHRERGLSKEQKHAQHKCPVCFCGPYQFGYNSQREAMEVRRLILAA